MRLRILPRRLLRLRRRGCGINLGAPNWTGLTIGIIPLPVHTTNQAASCFSRGTRLFAHGLGVVLAVAFASFGLQARGLIGERGIAPASQFLQMAYQALGAE